MNINDAVDSLVGLGANKQEVERILTVLVEEVTRNSPGGLLTTEQVASLHGVVPSFINAKSSRFRKNGVEIGVKFDGWYYTPKEAEMLKPGGRGRHIDYDRLKEQL